MKKFLLLTVIFTVLAISYSCRTAQQAKQVSGDSNFTLPTSVNDGHHASNSLDWDGTYAGIVPCADCEGIETQLTINKDKTYAIQTRYLGKNNSSFTETGTFNWNTNGNTIILSGRKNSPNQYFVGENKLIQLDMSGNRITGSLADKYILKKQ